MIYRFVTKASVEERITQVCGEKHCWKFKYQPCQDSVKTPAHHLFFFHLLLCTRWRRRRWCSPIWWCDLVLAPRQAPCQSRNLMISWSLELKSCSRMKLEMVSWLWLLTLMYCTALCYVCVSELRREDTGWMWGETKMVGSLYQWDAWSLIFVSFFFTFHLHWQKPETLCLRLSIHPILMTTICEEHLKVYSSNLANLATLDWQMNWFCGQQSRLLWPL